MTKKKPLSPELKQECDELNRIFQAKKDALDLSQTKVADTAKMSSAAISQYLGGINALNLPIAATFSKLLVTPIASFSERLASEANMIIDAVDYVRVEMDRQAWREKNEAAIRSGKKLDPRENMPPVDFGPPVRWTPPERMPRKCMPGATYSYAAERKIKQITSLILDGRISEPDIDILLGFVERLARDTDGRATQSRD